ncbi:MAG TPA: glutamate-cysteine ligase family protein [Methanothrix sp.]|nr:glutamate-cysteine ligase family protein [Methanothrix sp.]HPT19696.1 glutamate-cysteine ligase family protein [Methanothrix sp.]
MTGKTETTETVGKANPAGRTRLAVSSPVGTEHEYSINDKDHRPLAISDRIIRRIAGELQHEVPFAGILVSKELQKHAIELIPKRPAGLSELEEGLYRGLLELYHATNNEYAFMGLGMHPLLTLDQTTYWDHDEQEYYEAYDRIFNINQHGWLNIQALQINIPYRGEEELVAMFNRIRSLIPYLVAVSASSPMVEGRLTPYMDNRLVYYRQNQDAIPQICRGILPERLAKAKDYVKINRQIYSELKKRQAEILCREWVNSRGVIVRFTRSCLEVKAIDEQECLHSDMAVSAFLLAALRSDLELEEEESSLLALLEDAMRRGTAGLRPELEKLFASAEKSATAEERRYLPLIARRIEEGCLAEVMVRRLKEGDGAIKPLLSEMQWCLKENRPFQAEPGRCG